MSDNIIELESKEGKVSKVIKAKSFDILSSALACCIFIVLQIVMELLMNNLPGFIANSFLLSFLLSLLVEGVFFFTALSVAKIQDIDLYEATDIKKKINGRTALICLIIAVISLFAFSPLTNSFVYTLQKLGYKSEMGSITIPNGLTYLIYVILVCVSPAIFEEFLFRGVILNGLKKYGKHMAVFVSAFFFMIMHGGPDQTIHQFILGIVFGYVFVETKSLWSTILMHFFNNFYAVTMLFILSLSGANQTEVVAEELPSWQAIGLDLVIGLVLAAIGGYLIYLLIKALRKKKNEKEQVEQLLDSDINQVNIEELKELAGQKEEKKKVEPENKKRITILFITSVLYLVTIWIKTLIEGL